MEAASWARLRSSDSYYSYSKRTLTAMAWSLDMPIAKCTSAVMSAGGLIALLNGDGTMPGTRMQLFSGSGELLSAWEWDYGRVRALGWTPTAELVCVLESGRIMYWNPQGKRTADFALGDAIGRDAVLQCETFPDGCVILTSAFRLFALLSFAHRVVVPLADPRLASPPTAMAILPRGTAGDAAGAADFEPMAAASAAGLVPGMPRCPEVLLATASRTILVVDEHEAHDQLLASGPFVHLAPSPNGKFLACFSASGSLLVISSDFSRHLSELNTHSTRPPRQLVWCGADSLLMPYGGSGASRLLMVGPYGDSVKYEYSQAPLLHPEVCARRARSRQRKGAERRANGGCPSGRERAPRRRRPLLAGHPAPACARPLGVVSCAPSHNHLLARCSLVDDPVCLCVSAHVRSPPSPPPWLPPSLAPPARLPPLPAQHTRWTACAF